MHDDQHTPDRQIAAWRTAIPPEEWTILTAYYQERLDLALAEAQADTAGSVLGADREAVEARLLDALEREADGLTHDKQLGAVPTANGVQHLPIPEGDPRAQVPIAPTKGTRKGATGGRSPMTPVQRAVGGISALVGLWFLWSLLGAGSKPEAAATTDTPLPGVTVTPGATPTPLVSVAAGEPVQVFYPVSLDLDTGADPLIFRVLAGASQLGGAWTPTLADGTAVWLNGSYLNPILCLPPSAAPVVGQLGRGTVLRLRPASGAVRTYTVARVRSVGRQEVDVLDQRRAGLTLVVCGTGGNERTIIEAVYRPEALPALAAGGDAPAQLADLARVRLVSVEPATATLDLPPDQQAIAVTVQVENLTTAPLTASELLDQLALPDALAEAEPLARPTIPATTTTTWRYRYRVPRTGGAATWSLLAPTGERIRLAVALPGQAPTPPITAQLDGPGTTRVPTGTGWRLTIPATVTVASPTTLPPDLVSAVSGTRPLAVQSTLLGQLAAGTHATQLTLEIPDVSTFDLRIGQQQFVVTLP